MSKDLGSFDSPSMDRRSFGDESGLNPKLMTAARLSQVSGAGGSRGGGFCTGGSLLGVSGLPYKSNIIPSRYSSVLQDYRRRGNRVVTEAK